MGKVILYLAALVALWMLLPDRVKPAAPTFAAVVKAGGFKTLSAAEFARNDMQAALEGYDCQITAAFGGEDLIHV